MLRTRATDAESPPPQSAKPCPGEWIGLRGLSDQQLRQQISALSAKLTALQEELASRQAATASDQPPTIPEGHEGVRLARYEVDIDIYHAAKNLIDRHGTRARTLAGRRLGELLGAGDETGGAAWADILFAIGEIHSEPQRVDAGD